MDLRLFLYCLAAFLATVGIMLFISGCSLLVYGIFYFVVVLILVILRILEYFDVFD